MSKGKLQPGGCQIGADPEFFFRGPNNEIVGSERVIPGEGLHLLGAPQQNYKTDPLTGQYLLDENRKYIPMGAPTRRAIHNSIFVQDGIQAEMNPQAFSCREAFATQIGTAFQQLKEHLANSPGIKICLDPFVELRPEEMEGLSERSRMLGCAPSLNYYDADAKTGVDQLTYMKRSAGGHVHLGLNGTKALMEKRSRIVPLLDILVGNTCVLIDRDPNAAERRKVYGRAGEHRLPKHGLEYRTLSNFWLQSYPLFSLVMGLSRMAVDVISTLPEGRPKWTKDNGYSQADWDKYYPKSNYWDAEAELLGLFGVTVKRPSDPSDPTYLLTVREAINNNDADLAWQNWKVVREFIEAHTIKQGKGGNRGLDCGSLDNFEFFARMVQADGGKFTRFFPGDPVENWIERSKGHYVNNTGRGAETFFSETMTPMREQWEAEQRWKAEQRIMVETTQTTPVIVEKPKRVIPRSEGGRFAKKAA